MKRKNIRTEKKRAPQLRAHPFANESAFGFSFKWVEAALRLASIKILAEKAKPLHRLGTAQPIQSVLRLPDRLILVVLHLQLIVALLQFQNRCVNMLLDE